MNDEHGNAAVGIIAVAFLLLALALGGCCSKRRAYASEEKRDKAPAATVDLPASSCSSGSCETFSAPTPGR